jgi:hypothetical protein
MSKKTANRGGNRPSFAVPVWGRGGIVYFADVGGTGPVRYGQFPFSIGILGSPDNHLPIGQAHPAGRTANGTKLWRLVVSGVEVAGRWVIIDRQFVRVDGRG